MTALLLINEVPHDCIGCNINEKCAVLDSNILEAFNNCQCRECLFKATCKEPCGDRKDLMYHYYMEKYNNHVNF
jgi:hypothetical protein